MQAFVQEGLARGERVAYFSRDGDVSVLAETLGGVGLGELVDEGRLVVGSAERAYFPEAGFDGAARVAAFADFAAQTAAEGYPALRVYADNGWMPAALPDPATWIDYELRVSQVVLEHALIGLCGFDADDGALTPGAVDAVHPVNLGPAERASRFRLTAIGDGFALTGELDRFTLDDLTTVLCAAAPLLHRQRLSLGGVSFCDAAAAELLGRYLQDVRPVVAEVSRPLTRLWQLLGLSPGGALA